MRTRVLPADLATSKRVFTWIGLMLVGTMCHLPSTVAAAGIEDYDSRQPIATSNCPDELSRLRCEVYNSALLEFQSRHALLRGGKTTLSETLATAQRVMNSEVALAGNDASLRKIFAAHLALADDLSRISEEKLKQGLITICERELTRQRYLAMKIKTTALDQGIQPNESAPVRLDPSRKVLELDVRKATLELEFAETELAEDRVVDKRSPGAIPPERMRRRKLQVELAKVALERASLMLDQVNSL